MKITLDLPDIEGFEIAEGKQPRHVKVGEYCLSMETLEAKQWNGACTSFDNAIVLKKKAPKYQVVKFDMLNKDKSYVEIKALEDAMSLLNSRGLTTSMPSDQYAVYMQLLCLINK